MDRVLRALERQFRATGDLSILPTLARLYARTKPDAPFFLWIVTCELPHKTITSVHATEEGAWHKIAEHLEIVVDELGDDGDAAQISRAIAGEAPFDDPEWFVDLRHIKHAYTLYQHIIRDLGGEHVGEIYINIEREQLEP